MWLSPRFSHEQKLQLNSQIMQRFLCKAREDERVSARLNFYFNN